MDLIIVQHFYDLPELALARRKLEIEGIKTVTRDENAMQTFSIIEARAIGGAKLLVDKGDYARASKFLIEIGIMNENSESEDFGIVNFLDRAALAIPGLRQFPKEFRIIVVSFLMIAIPFIGILLPFII